MKNKAQFIRKGRTVCRVWPNGNVVTLHTYKDEPTAAFRLRDFIRLDGGRLGPIPSEK